MDRHDDESAPAPASSTADPSPGDEVVLRDRGDVTALINSGRARPRRVWLITLVALGGIFVDFYDLSAFSVGAFQVKAQFGLTGSEVGLLTAMTGAGAAVGGVLGGYFVDRIGRFRMFVLDLMLFVVAAAFAAVAPNYLLLLVARFFIGFGVGLDVPVALAFITEFHAVVGKAKAVNVWPIVSASSVVFVYLLAELFHLAGAGDSLWRWTVGFGAVAAAAVLCLRYVSMTESPMWLATRGDLEGAAEILRKRFSLRVRVEPSGDAKVDDRPSPRAYLSLFGRRYRSRTVLITIVALTEAIGYYGIGFYTPTIVSDLFGEGLTDTLLASALTSAFGIVGAVLCMHFTQRLGFRGLGLIGYSLVAVVLITLGFLGEGQSVAVLVLLIGIFYAAHNFGPGTLPSSMGSLSYPTHIRGVGGGYTQLVIRVGSIIGLYVFPTLLDRAGLNTTVLIVATMPIAGLLALTLIPWDPAGKDVDLDDEQPSQPSITRGSR